MPRDVPEWIGKDDNEPVPPRVRMRVLLRFGRVCQGCTRVIRPGDGWTCDHTQALINGGANRESNLNPRCNWCNPEKNRADVAEKSKTYEMARRHAGVKRPRTITGWRRFSGEIVRAPRERT